MGSERFGTEAGCDPTDTILGKKVSNSSRAATRCAAGATLPVGQSTTPYQIYDAFFDVTKAAQGWDIDTVKQSLHVLSQTIDQTYPHLSPALEGVEKFSATIGKRDEEVKHLLGQANKVASILGDRSDQIDRFWSTPRRCWPPSTSAARRSTPCSATSRRSPNRSRA